MSGDRSKKCEVRAQRSLAFCASPACCFLLGSDPSFTQDHTAPALYRTKPYLTSRGPRLFVSVPPGAAVRPGHELLAAGSAARHHVWSELGRRTPALARRAELFALRTGSRSASGGAGVHEARGAGGPGPCAGWRPRGGRAPGSHDIYCSCSEGPKLLLVLIQQ